VLAVVLMAVGSFALATRVERLVASKAAQAKDE
jgi:hypothetical protein